MIDLQVSREFTKGEALSRGKGLMKLPGMADVHVHLRVPGGEHKEDYFTGSAAAIAGGITQMIAMPNTTPPITTMNSWKKAQLRASKESLSEVNLMAGASVSCLSELEELGRNAIALKLYMDSTYGELRVEGEENLDQIARLWPPDKVLAVHAEGESVRTGIRLAEKFHRRVHFCHVSRADEINWIAQAKGDGQKITCEVTPHHLFLTEDDAKLLGALGDMRPRLGKKSDVAELWKHINSTIDCVASDHAPHTLKEKQDEKNPPPGVPGLESMLPLMLTAVSERRLTMDRLIELLSINPRKIYGLSSIPETWVEVDLESTYTFPDHVLFTKCGWSPFEGFSVKGRICRVVLRGREVYRDGLIKSLAH